MVSEEATVRISSMEHGERKESLLNQAMAAEGAWHLLDDNPAGLITINGPAPPTPKWVVEAWEKALERRGVLEKAPETASEL